MFTTLANSPNWQTSNLTAPQLDWATFQKYIAPTLYSGDPRALNNSRDQWAKSLGWDLGGVGNYQIEGLNRDQFFSKYAPEVNGGSGDNAGAETLNAMNDAFNNPEAQQAWKAAVDKALKDPNTVYRLTGDQGPGAGERARRTALYTLKDGKLVPIAQTDYTKRSATQDFVSDALPGLALVGGLGALSGLGVLGSAAPAAGNGAFLGEGIASGVGGWDTAAGLGGLGEAAAGAAGGYIPANAAGALGGIGAPGSTAGFQYGQLAGSLTPTTSGAAVDPITAYLTSGGAEGSILGSGVTGAGGAAGAVGSGTAANLLGNAANWLGGSNALGIPNWLNLGGNLLNSYLGYNASRNAADIQARSAAEANQLQKYMFDTIRSDNTPALQARNAGLAGYSNLLRNPSQITSDPGYQFGFKQGQAGYDNSGSARGMRLSGGQAKALTQFGQDYGQTMFDRSLNRYANQAGLGQVGAGTIANAGQNYANQAGNNITGAGNAAAAGYIGGANAISGGVNNFLRNWQESNLLRQFGFGS